jgi:hypothetical protein
MEPEAAATKPQTSGFLHWAILLRLSSQSGQRGRAHGLSLPRTERRHQNAHAEGNGNPDVTHKFLPVAPRWAIVSRGRILDNANSNYARAEVLGGRERLLTERRRPPERGLRLGGNKRLQR